VLNIRSLRFRLAVWYFCTVTAICALAATGYWFAIRSELNHALDQGLRYRLIGLREFLEAVEPGGDQEIAARLNEISQLGELYQVFDADGALIAQSYGLERHRLRQRPPADLGFAIRYGAGGTADFPLRLAWQRVTIGSHTLTLGVADPQRKFAGILRAFTTVLLLSTPFILALATVCGLWLGRRALAPVARIADDARTITESNLSARLAVPSSQDELQQLSETLNDMLERIERSFTRTRQFTADASHELRAPMTLIHTAAQYSLRRERSREELVDSMQKILRESQRTTALIDDLLLLARGDAGKEPTALTEMDAAPLLRDAAEQAVAMASPKDIAVTLQLESGVLPVRGNEAQLRRLLLILVDNALKYTPGGGRVTISGSADGSDVTISVADTGAGISPDDLPHVFERFWRADKVRSRESGGTGLGLTIAKQIADLHGAQLGVESEIGRGSTFSARFPGVSPNAARPRRETRARAS
jgi:heavy metal sensor kinase